MSDTQKNFKITSKGKIITTEAQIKELNDKKNRSVNNEKLWTWFVAKIMEYPKYNNRVFDYLFNKSIDNINSFNIGFEVQPLSPRSGTRGKTEGNTHLDLAIGNITNRGKIGKSGEIEGSGIKYKSKKPGMVCFIEAKMFSDLSTGIAHDKFRNQMTRVIENLLCFQGFQNDLVKFPDDICFTLLTPRAFKLKPKSRLFGYKFLEYSNDLITSSSLIEYDINQLNIDKRFDDNKKNKWKYPILSERLKALRLNWATYEDIFEVFLERSIDLLNNDNRKSTFNELTKRLFHNN